MKLIWSWIVYVFERADIIPPIIAVSAWHYAGALMNKDPWWIAIILGALVDIGHYRAVKSFFKVRRPARFVLMAVLTVLTGWYHYLWYRDWMLAAGMPMLIIGLALLSTWEHWERQAVKIRQDESGDKLPIIQPQITTVSKRDWRTLPDEDRQLVAGMATSDIVSKYGIPDRTARNWKRAARNGHKTHA